MLISRIEASPKNNDIINISTILFTEGFFKIFVDCLLNNTIFTNSIFLGLFSTLGFKYKTFFPNGEFNINNVIILINSIGKLNTEAKKLILDVINSQEFLDRFKINILNSQDQNLKSIIRIFENYYGKIDLYSFLIINLSNYIENCHSNRVSLITIKSKLLAIQTLMDYDNINTFFKGKGLKILHTDGEQVLCEDEKGNKFLYNNLGESILDKSISLLYYYMVDGKVYCICYDGKKYFVYDLYKKQRIDNIVSDMPILLIVNNDNGLIKPQFICFIEIRKNFFLDLYLTNGDLSKKVFSKGIEVFLGNGGRKFGYVIFYNEKCVCIRYKKENGKTIYIDLFNNLSIYEPDRGEKLRKSSSLDETLRVIMERNQKNLGN